MVSRRKIANNHEQTRRPPAKTPEERENQLIGRAVDLAERQLTEGTASAQVISFYLKLGSSRERLEQERIQNEVELLKIKKETLESEKRVEELYREAMDAFRSYSGTDIDADEEDDDYYD